MVVTIPALWFNGIPPLTPAAIGSAPIAMLVLLGLLAAAVVLLARASRGTARRAAPVARRHLRAVQASTRAVLPVPTGCTR
jgi:hypothetical protein